MRRDRPPSGAFHHAKWHDWYVCRGCGAVIEDWGAHAPCPRAELDELRALLGGPQEAAEGLEELAQRARQEGAAVAEAAMWRGGGRQIAALVAADWRWLRKTLRRAPEGRPAAKGTAPAPDAAGRAAAWARIDGLIERTTGRA